ncbi:MAG: acyl-CoA dehydrogenase family protein [Pseudomonadota bacterium]
MDMSERLVLDTAERIFREHVTPALRERAAAGEFPQALWSALEAQGLFAVTDPELGLPAALPFELLKLAGRFAVPLPLAETLLATRWLEATPAEPTTIGLGPSAGAVLAPWGQQFTAVLRVSQPVPEAAAGTTDRIERIGVTATVPAEHGLALEPLSTVEGRVQDELVVPDACAELALSRAALMSGALETVLELALRYASEREQFGRPLSRFQAIQHQIAVLAAEVAAAQMATAGAIAAFGAPGWPEAAAAAKIRAGEAAGIVSELAHQVHGAMGYTREHELHQFTLRLLRWRDEYGHEAEWQRWLGDRLLDRGAEQCWAFITDGGAAAGSEQNHRAATGTQEP